MKRFTETEKWRDPWFQKLDSQHRTLWVWLCDRVDNSGVIDICWPICNAETTGNFSEESMKVLGDRVERLNTGKWWIPGFVPFQVGELSMKSKPHIYINNLLKKHGLDDRVNHRPYRKVSHTFKEKEQEKEKDKDKEPGWFDEFWALYPKKKARGDAFKAWNKLCPSLELKDSILKAVLAQSKLPDWTKEGGKFIPFPASWLNAARWEDELEVGLFENKRPSFDEIEALKAKEVSNGQ